MRMEPLESLFTRSLFVLSRQCLKMSVLDVNVESLGPLGHVLTCRIQQCKLGCQTVA